MKKHLLTIALISTAILPAWSQECGTDRKHEELLRSKPAYARLHKKDKADWNRYQKSSETSRVIITGKDTVYEIPVVVHVIHSGETIGSYYNPSKAAIDSMMEYLNKSWAATWPSYPAVGSGGVDLKIRFVLAKRTVDCDPTDGINRIDGSVLANYAANGVIYASSFPGPSDAQLKALSRWPSNEYYNIWIVKYLDGPSGYYAGYAYYPGAGELDGTVIAARYVRPLTPGSSNFWYTIPHELGHAFNLLHTFTGSSGPGSCPSNTDCTIDGDGICDTEPHDFRDGTCPSGINPCTGVAYAGVQYNLMNYSTCFDRFTPTQKEKVVFALNKYRLGLVSSLGGTATDPAFTPPAKVCTPGIDNPDMQDIGPHNVLLADLEFHSMGNTLDGGIAYRDLSCSQGIVHLQRDSVYKMSVSSGSLSERVKAWIDYNNNGTFDASELVLNHVSATSIPYETHIDTFRVPLSAVINTPVRMRVRGDDKTIDGGACDDLNFGQAEDFSVIIAKEKDKPSAIIDLLATSVVRLYPNPVQDLLHVDCKIPVHVSIYSIDRRLLQNSDNTIVNMTGLAPGLYHAQVTDIDGNILLNSKVLNQ